MNPQNNPSAEGLPESYAEALERLRKSGNSRYRSMSYVLKNVRTLLVVPRFRSQRVKNPARQVSVWAWLTAEEYVWTSVRDLGELYADGASVGRLHGSSEDQATAVAALLAAAGPSNVVISGHFTESGWYVDSVTVTR